MIGTNGLDNPLWASLETLHRRFARGEAGVARYPAEVAPFLAAIRDGHDPLRDGLESSRDGHDPLRDGLESSRDDHDPQRDPRDPSPLASLVAPGETVYLIGPRPAVPAGWQLEELGSLLQMVCDAPDRLPAVDAGGLPAVHVGGPRAVDAGELPGGAAIVALGEDRGDDVRALAALVYPHYFRPQTTALGRYVGIYDGATLVAMAGERMGFPGYREISAVCTHPDHVGRGLARRLLAHLGRNIAAGGATPFLHVSPGNLRAVRLYEQNGYRVRREIAFAALRRG